MIKEDCDKDFISGNTFIGFRNDYDYGYCRKCGNIFKYNWNGCNPLSENKTCPKCGEFSEVETKHHIETHIEIIKMFRDHDILSPTDDSKEYCRKEINELNRIRREFDKYKESHT